MEALQFTVEVLGMTEDLKELGRLREELTRSVQAQKDLKKAYDDGKISADKYREQSGLLKVQHDALASSTKALNSQINAEATAFKGAEGSMTRMAHELGNLRVQYRNLSQAERENAEIGGKLLISIQNQDAALKKLDASIGNHQRNVGNYPGLMGMMGSSLASNIPILGTLAGAITGVTSQTAAATGATGGISKGMMIAGGAILAATAAFGMLYSAISDGIKLSIKSEERMSMLTFALNGNALAAEEMAAYAGKLANTSLFKKGDLIDAENYALTLGRTEAQTKKVVEAAMGLSRATGVDLHTAVAQISATYEGQIGKMGKVEGNLKNLTKEELASGVAVDILYNKFARFGHEGLETAGGQMAMAEKKMAAFHKNMAELWMPIVVKATEKWMEFWSWVNGGNEKGVKSNFMQDFAKQQADAMTAATKSGQDVIIKINEDRAASFYKLWKAATDPAMRAQYAKNYDEQLEINKKLRKQQEELNSKGDFTDPDAEKKRAEEAKKAAEKYAKSLEDRASAIKDNNDYILKLTADLMTAKTNAIQDQQTREIAMEQTKFDQERTVLLNSQAEKLVEIDKNIKVVTDKKGKATAEEKAQVKQLEDEKYAIIASTADLILQKQEALGRSQADIRKKYSNQAKDDEITQKFTADTSSAERDAKIKLDALHSYYSQRSTLTKEELEKEKSEENKILVDLYNKKYQLILSEIQQRKALGTITEEDYKKQLEALAKLQNQVVAITQQDDKKNKSKSGKQKFTSFVAKTFGIEDQEAAAIIAQAEQLAGKIYQTWQRVQQQRIDNELAMDKQRIQTQEDINLASLEKQHSQGIISDQIYNTRKKEIQDKADGEKREAEKKAFEAKKEQAIIDIIINAAVGAIAAYQLGPIAGTIFAAIIAGLAIYEISEVSKQQFVGARGGIVNGPPHSQGGVKFGVGGYVAELEGGEGVLNKRIMNDNTVYTVQGNPKQIGSFLNTRNGWGNSFDPGGYSPVGTSFSRSNARISDASIESINALIDGKIANIKVYQVESEITKKQGDAKKLKTLAEW